MIGIDRKNIYLYTEFDRLAEDLDAMDISKTNNQAGTVIVGPAAEDTVGS